MKVLALVTEAFGGPGGIAQYNRDFISALAESGLASRVDVLPRNGVATTLPDGVTQAPPRRGKLGYAAAALRIAARSRPGIVFCGHLHMAALAAAAAAVARARLVVQVHGVEAWQPPSPLIRRAVRSAALVLSVSRYTRQRVLEWSGLRGDTVAVVPDTVDPAFTPGDESALRNEWGLGSATVLLTVGRMDALERYKGHDRVIAALPRLVAEGHDVQYLIIGDGSDRPRLEALAAEHGVVDRTRFLGSVDRPTLIRAYRLADLFVMPSTGEGFGIAYLEAMASGTPALGLSAGGAVDALVHPELGTAVSEADFPGALSRALQRPRADSVGLSAAVHDRFGRRSFVGHVQSALAPLLHEIQS